jgi:hypothetical protein
MGRRQARAAVERHQAQRRSRSRRLLRRQNRSGRLAVAKDDRRGARCAFLPPSLPTYLPTCLPACLPACFPSFLPSFLPAFLSSCLLAVLLPKVFSLAVPHALCLTRLFRLTESFLLLVRAALPCPALRRYVCISHQGGNGGGKRSKTQSTKAKRGQDRKERAAQAAAAAAAAATEEGRG